MRKSKTENRPGQATPAARAAESDGKQLQSRINSGPGFGRSNSQHLSAAIHGSPNQALQRKQMQNLAGLAATATSPRNIPAFNSAVQMMEPAVADSELAPAGVATGEATAADKDEEEVSPWMREVGFRLLGYESDPANAGSADPGAKEGEEAEQIKDDEPVEPAAPVEGLPLNSFMREPGKYQKLKNTSDSFEKLQESLQQKSKPAPAEGEKSEGDLDSEEEEQVSEYSEGIIDLVKSGFQNCMKLKTAYEEYQLVQQDSEQDASKLEGSKLAFEVALSGTSSVLSAINSYQKSFGSAQSLAIQAAIPAIGIALSTISLIGRIVTLVQQGSFDFGQTATDSQTFSVLSMVQGDEKQKAEIKQVLESEKFRLLITATAEYRQQERDNPAIFTEYRQAAGNQELQDRLRKRYPSNYARIDEIHKANSLGIEQIGPETEKLMGMGVSKAMLEAIIEDQTLMNHLEEVKEKRSTNAKIGIFTDLVNIGADIATLTGTGAVVGTAMRAGTAAIGLARSGGNAIKFAARGKGAEDFSSGAEGGLFGASMFDSTDILKNDAAKQERYFHSARLLVNNIADHDKKVADTGKTTEIETAKAINAGYGWVETKILGTGASVSVVKAMANSGKKSGDEIVSYLIDKMKTR